MTTEHSPADIVAEFLIDGGVLTRPTADDDWPGYIGFMPDGTGVPNDAVAVINTIGVKDGRLMAGDEIDHPGIQIRIRSDDPTTGWEKTAEIANALQAVNHTSVALDSSTTYTLVNVSRVTPPIALGLETGVDGRAKQTHIFVINYLITISE